MKFFVIGDEDTVMGFRLAGVEGEIVRTPEEAQNSLDRAFRTEGVGVILMTERTAQSVREELDRIAGKAELPLIVEIPDGRGPMEGRRTVKEMIRQAVGVSL